MIYNEENSLNELIVENTIMKLSKYKIIILVDESICEYANKIKYLENILSLFEYYDLFFLNKTAYISVNSDNISEIYKYFSYEWCQSFNYYQKIIEIYNIYDSIYDKQYILIMLLNNISIDYYGISNMDKFYEIINKSEYYIYIILFIYNIEYIYKYYFNNRIIIIDYSTVIEKYPNNIIYLFKNIPYHELNKSKFFIFLKKIKKIKRIFKLKLR